MAENRLLDMYGYTFYPLRDPPHKLPTTHSTQGSQGLQYFAKRNETKRNGTLRNGTLRNGTLRNGTLRNGTLRNGTLRNGYTTQRFITPYLEYLEFH